MVLFDVNGTLVDTSAIGPELRRIFGPIITAREFYLETIQYTLALTVMGEYANYDVIAEAVLKANAEAHGVKLKTSDIEAVRGRLTSLPAFGDAEASLRRLKDAGYRLATLTNSTADSQKRLLKTAGLDSFFEQLSVEKVKQFKPAASTYLSAAEALGVPPSEILMAAAHSRDLLGARKAGCRTAFVSRPGEGWFVDAERPDLSGPDLASVAGQILNLKH